ncbi:MAG: hypothetical protein HETSPECPRED_002755 [Heterodermia speciosa]|uniref:Amidase domain-containing protein n=1 Tax=Heterodermia speciosa TaxID=116794 RepID=A0A8H3EYW5_9LECA|nr:MAG: hypothetical protein HETSPECPRED_002755 [Heterodermia speciosa]
MTNFASSDEPPDQWIDDIRPTNPRGDQYQSPSSSSSGAAATLAGYSWLDQSIGADTGGSIRAPATANGLFSLRPSWNTTSMDGIGAIYPDFDVVGILGRNLQSIHDLLSLTHDVDDVKEFPSKILYPEDFFPHSNKSQQAMVDNFVTVLEHFLGARAIRFSLAERWRQNPPSETGDRSITEYLAQSAFWPMCYSYYHTYEGFRKSYREKYGSEPYVGPVVRFRWGIGETVSQQDFHKGRAELQVFRQWFDANVLSSDPVTMSDAIMIMPYGMGGPKYRDAPNSAPSTSSTISEKLISPALQMPQLVIPTGQNPYGSRVSGRTEYRPIGTTILGARGSDLMLINLAKAALEWACWPTEVQTGPLMFELGEGVRHTADVAEGDSGDGKRLAPEENQGFSLNRVNAAISSARMLKPTQPLFRALRRLALTTKMVNGGFYKGNRTGSMGRHTKGGGYIIEWRKVRTYVAPANLAEFKVACFMMKDLHAWELTGIAAHPVYQRSTYPRPWRLCRRSDGPAER